MYRLITNGQVVNDYPELSDALSATGIKMTIMMLAHIKMSLRRLGTAQLHVGTTVHQITEVE